MDHRLWTVVADFYARLDASIGYVSLTRGRRAYDVDQFAVLCSEPKFFDKLMAAVNKALFEEFQDDISNRPELVAASGRVMCNAPRLWNTSFGLALVGS